MAHASALARFDDGTILHCEYDGTEDFMCPHLYPTFEEMHQHWRKQNFKLAECVHEYEPVQLYSTYGGGFHWRARACRKCNTVDPKK